MLDNYSQRLQDIRFQYLDRQKKRKGDLFISLWLNLKVALCQSNSPRMIKKEEKELQKFFDQAEIKALLSENRALAEQAIFKELKDSALVYQQSCAEDQNYTSKLFGLMKMKEDEVANKAGSEVYELMITSLMKMQETFWRNQMIAALHLAYQEVFGPKAIKADLYFTQAEENGIFENILNATLLNKGNH